MNLLTLLVVGACILQSTHIDAASPSRFANFLLNNKFNTSDLPLSYRVPYNYFAKMVPENRNPTPQYVAACGRTSTVDELNAYTLQTEQFLTTYGVNLYDAAVREIALSLLGHTAEAQSYEQKTLVEHKTFQLGNIRGSAACHGIEYYNQCDDTTQSGSCGFCYGGNTAGHAGVSEDDNHAYFFRLIGDIWAFDGTVDARCPEKKIPWTWNDWRPVAGENAWANFVGPLQSAYIKAGGNVNNIDDQSSAMQLAVNMFATFQTMQMPNGAIAYAPWNTYDSGNPALGGTASTENAASSLAGLKALLYVLQNKGNTQYKSLVPQVQSVIDKLTGFIKSAYSPSNGFFIQGGTYDKNGNFQWNNDANSLFAVDCQTWVMSVVGPAQVDAWFGAGTALNIWQTTKKIGGYKYNAQQGTALGLGFSVNQQVQVFSGEWTFGGVNMLRIFAKQYPSQAQALTDEADDLRQAIEDYLSAHDNTFNTDVVNYANKRYYIPWGWYANPIPSTASVSWAVMVDSNFNPFKLGGAYSA